MMSRDNQTRSHIVNTFITRRPVLDANGVIAAYQLGYLASTQDGGSTDPDVIANHVIADVASYFGVEAVAVGRRLLVPCSRDALIRGFAEALPAETTVAEIPADVRVDDVVVDACRALKDAGYGLAVHRGAAVDASPLDALASFVKIDSAQMPSPRIGAAWRPLVAEYRGRATLIADGVESWDAFQALMGLGVDLAAGSFYCTPSLLIKKSVEGRRDDHLQILIEVNRSEIRIDEIEEIIKRDPTLTFRLLTYINSAHSGIRHEVRSIRHAVVLLGERELKRWVSLVVLTSLASRKPAALVQTGLLRARLAESLAPDVGLEARADEIFLVGLLSVLDAVLDRPLADILRSLPLADDLSAGLRRGDNPIGRLLLVVLSYLDGDWPTFLDHAALLSLDPGSVPTRYRKALAWSETALVTEEAA